MPVQKLLVTGDDGEHDGALVWRLLICPEGSGRWLMVGSTRALGDGEELAAIAFKGAWRDRPGRR